ncbi:MAG TPA: hypothetical protein DDW20_02100 [Firmicutes bacterium]|nr:hypothetical protein [Bacillota bacterium]
MNIEILIQVVLLGIALSMDAFAVSITDGLIYKDIKKKHMFFIAGVFGFMQAIMPLIGFWIVELITVIVGESGGEQAGNIMTIIVTWLSFALLLFIGGKMLVEAIIDLKKPTEEKQPRSFSIKEVLIMGVATAIDALAVGVSLHADTYVDETKWVFLHVTIIMAITFAISLCGLFFGKTFTKLLKGKFEITSIIGGVILICLGIWIVLGHYLGI